MQVLKTLLIVAVLSAVSYGVYAALTGARDVGPPPGAPANDYQEAPQIELPSFDAPSSSASPPSVPNTIQPHVVQPQPNTFDAAPPFSSPPSNGANAAPPYVAPSVGPSESAPPSASYDPMNSLSPAADAAIAPANPWPENNAPPPYSDAPPAAEYSLPAQANTENTAPPSTFPSDLATAQQLLAENRLDRALLMLSKWYDDPRLTQTEQQTLLDLLNQLAGTVIYSREHLLLPAHEVKPNETLEQIAQAYRVPWQLLAKINGIQDANRLRPGEKLKVVQGPFDAIVNLRAAHLTLMLGGRYAGRFPIGAPAEQAAPEGEFLVKDKHAEPAAGPNAGPAAAPQNPLAKYWIGLGDQLGIYGSDDAQTAMHPDLRGCIRLGARDIEDVYDMMTLESRVRIIR